MFLSSWVFFCSCLLKTVGQLLFEFGVDNWDECHVKLTFHWL